MDTFFVDALVRASLCRTHASSAKRPQMHSQKQRPPSEPAISQPEEPAGYSEDLKFELVSIVDPYIDELSKKTESGERKQRQEPQSFEVEHLPWLKPSTPEEERQLEHFLFVLKNPDTHWEDLFDLYRKIPSPRLPYLSLQYLEMLVSRFMTVPLRNETSMLRYLSLLDDMQSCDIPISRNEWNAAISFAVRSFKTVTLAEVRVAFKLLEESESKGGKPADATTFNILLDMAVRFEKPAMVKLIIDEMASRGIGFDRFTHTTLIMYHGTRGDGEKIREAYSDLIDAGELVDTVVLNAVMTALIRAKEVSAAEYMYENMKAAALGSTAEPTEPTEPTEPAPEGWRETRQFAKKLKKIAAKRKLIDGYKKKFNVSLAPDIITFCMLILHYCRMGNPDKVHRFLSEMSLFEVAADASIFICLLKGFYWHGGVRYSQWTQEWLDVVFAAILDEERGLKMESSVAIWSIRALAKVSNSKDKVLKAWDVIEARWINQGGKVDEAVVRLLHEIVGPEALEQHLRGSV